MVPLAPGEWNTEMLLSILLCTGHPTAKKYLVQNVSKCEGLEILIYMLLFSHSAVGSFHSMDLVNFLSGLSL